MKKQPGLGTVDFSDIIKHVRQMAANPDPLAILVRGMILIDKGLDELIERTSPIPLAKLDSELKHPGLLQKATLACALGAISEGELSCIRTINRLRNDVAHKLPSEVTAHDEERVVKVFRSGTKLFSGMDYHKDQFPKTFVFLLITFGFLLSSRAARPDDLKIKHVVDESNTEAMIAIIFTGVITQTLKVDLTDDEIMQRVTELAVRAKTERDAMNQKATE